MGAGEMGGSGSVVIAAVRFRSGWREARCFLKHPAPAGIGVIASDQAIIVDYLTQVVFNSR